ncbi:hypothetical protein RHCRD62_80223 [Rhodococcus sp. RD6.2]|nr:hypothetical protein RHCRD62_80223 [Rhodococcus sp. RD6.2]
MVTWEHEFTWCGSRLSWRIAKGLPFAIAHRMLDIKMSGDTP